MCAGWLRRQGFNATLRVENTPRGQLARQIRARIRNDPDLACMKILVIEKNGTQLGKVSNFSDPEVEDYCWLMLYTTEPFMPITNQLKRICNCARHES